MIITRFAHAESPDFWLWLGPVFADPNIGAQFCNSLVSGKSTDRCSKPNNLYTSLISNSTFTWWIATSCTDLLGFCAAQRTTVGVLFTYAYVYAAHRRQGIYRQLFERRLNDVQMWTDISRIYAYPNDRSRAMFEQHGFTLTADPSRRTVAEWFR